MLKANNVLGLSIGDIVTCTRDMLEICIPIHCGELLDIVEWRFETISIDENASGTVILRSRVTGKKFAIDIHVFSKYFTLYKKHDDIPDSLRYTRYSIYDEQVLAKMYEPRNSKYNPLDYTKYNPKHVLLNGRYTTVVWEDGSHTVVKLAKGEEYDPEKAILYAIIKHMNGDVKAETDRYLDRFIDKTIYKSQSKKEFLKECDAIDAAGGLNQEYNPDEDETFFDDEEEKNKCDLTKFLKVKDLKKLLSNIPDELYITVTSSETERHISHVTSVGILESEFEYPSKCLSFCCDSHDISEETDLTSEVLFNGFEKTEMEEDSDDTE